jgi:phenylacetate-CoA ligase
MIKMLARQLYYVGQTMRNQWKSPEELRKIQEKRLKKLIQYAYDHTELYHKKFREANITPSDFNTLKDIKKFPCVTKAEIRDNFPAGVVSNEYDVSRCLHSATSGSTGEVLHVAYSRAAYEYYMAVTYRNFAALGFKPWHRFAYTRYGPVEIGSQFYEKLGITKRKHISVFLKPADQVAALKKFNPHAITGYPSVMMEWAKLLEGQDNGIHPLFVRTEAELLTKEAKKFMEDTFNCELYEEYGSAEFIHMAFKCLQDGYHISSDSVVLEFLDHGEDVASGEEGTVHITSLVNYAMPFIRYNLNDIAVPLDGVCPCGRTLPLMKLIVGKDEDFFVLPSGKKIGPRLVMPIFEMAAGVKEFRMVQKRKDLLQIDIVPGLTFTEKDSDDLKRTLLGTMGEPVEIVFNLCEDIPRGRHNRPRPMRSLVQG